MGRRPIYIIPAILVLTSGISGRKRLAGRYRPICRPNPRSAYVTIGLHLRRAGGLKLGMWTILMPRGPDVPFLLVHQWVTVVDRVRISHIEGRRRLVLVVHRRSVVNLAVLERFARLPMDMPDVGRTLLRNRSGHHRAHATLRLNLKKSGNGVRKPARSVYSTRAPTGLNGYRIASVRRRNRRMRSSKRHKERRLVI